MDSTLHSVYDSPVLVKKVLGKVTQRFRKVLEKKGHSTLIADKFKARVNEKLITSGRYNHLPTIGMDARKFFTAEHDDFTPLRPKKMKPVSTEPKDSCISKQEEDDDSGHEKSPQRTIKRKIRLTEDFKRGMFLPSEQAMEYERQIIKSRMNQTDGYDENSSDDNDEDPSVRDIGFISDSESSDDDDDEVGKTVEDKQDDNENDDIDECSNTPPDNIEELSSDEESDGIDHDFIDNCQNLILCQYDLVRRNKDGHFKMQLINGCMYLRGFDFVFKRAQADAKLK